MDTYTFHIFTIVATILFWLLLKSYKSSISGNNGKSKSNFVYVLFVPIILYIMFFWIHKPNYFNSTNIVSPPIPTIKEPELLSSPFPDSISLSS